MSRKRIRRIIVAVSVFYVLVAVMAFLMLKDSDSVLAKQTMAEILFDKETVTEQSTTVDSPDDILERWTEAKTVEPVTEIPDLPTEELTEMVTETPIVTEEATEFITERATETKQVTEEVTEQAAETVTSEEMTSETTEKVTETDTGEATDLKIEVIPQADGKYYLFEYGNTKQRLLMRETGNKSAKVVGDMKAHTRGAVLELEDGWSKVYADGRIGYCYTDYIQITEVKEDEYRTFLEEKGVLQ